MKRNRTTTNVITSTVLIASIAACSPDQVRRDVDVLVSGKTPTQGHHSDSKTDISDGSPELAIANVPFTTACAAYPCGIATRRVSPSASIAPGVAGFEMIGSVNLNRELGGDDLQQLSDGTLVARSKDGSVHWIQPSAEAGGEITASYNAIKGTSAQLVVLPNDQVVAANRHGELFWLERGVKIAQVSLGSVRAMVGTPDNTVVVTTTDQIYWVKDGKRVAQQDIPNNTVPANDSLEVLADGVAVFGAGRSESDGVRVMHWMSRNEAIASLVTTGQYLAALPDGTIVATNEGRAEWIKNQKTFATFTFKNVVDRVSPAIPHADGSVTFSYVIQDRYKGVVTMKDGRTVGALDLSTANETAMPGRLPAPTVLSNGTIAAVFSNSVPRFVAWHTGLAGYMPFGRFPGSSSAAGASSPIVLSNGTTIVADASGVISWFRPYGAISTEPLKRSVTVDVRDSSWSGFDCSSGTPATGSGTIAPKTFTFDVYGNDAIKLADSFFKCSNGSLRSNVAADGSFAIFCRFGTAEGEVWDGSNRWDGTMELQGQLRSDNTITLNKYRERGCMANGHGFSAYRSELDQ